MLRHVVETIPEARSENINIGIPVGIGVPGVRGKFHGIWASTGQATTVYQILQSMMVRDGYLKPSPVLVLDCDMLLGVEDLIAIVELTQIYRSVVAVTETFDPNASRVDRIPFPTMFVEKEPISQYGIVSARAFDNAVDLKDCIGGYLETLPPEREPFLSEAMNAYPGPSFAYKLSQSFVDWGTPERVLSSGAIFA